MVYPFIDPQQILSIGPGMRGIESGLERAGIETNVVAYVEIETFIIWNIIEQMESGVLAPAPIFADLKKFEPRPFRNKIHGITAGYPCQPFSVAGNQEGPADPRHLYPYIEHCIDAIRPIWCYFENVSNHLNIGFDQVYRSLHNLGYSVEAGLYTAEQIGAPHERERLFILAIDRRTLADANRYEQTKDRGNLAEMPRLSPEERQNERSPLFGGTGRNEHAELENSNSGPIRASVGTDHTEKPGSELENSNHSRNGGRNNKSINGKGAIQAKGPSDLGDSQHQTGEECREDQLARAV